MASSCSGSCNTNPEEQEMQRKLAENMKRIKHKIVVMSGKGGVGKSTVAANIGYVLAGKGFKTGILDCDIHGPTIPKMLGIENSLVNATETGEIEPFIVPPNLKVLSMGLLIPDNDAPIIWRGPLKMNAIQDFLASTVWGDLDYLVIDLPPGTGDESLSIAQLIPDADGAVIVTTPQEVALLSVRKSINFARKINLNVLGIIENMSGYVCPKCGEPLDIFKTGGGKKASEDFSVSFLGAVPLDAAIVQNADTGKALASPDDGSATSQAFMAITDKIIAVVDGAAKEGQQ